MVLPCERFTALDMAHHTEKMYLLLSATKHPQPDFEPLLGIPHDHDEADIFVRRAAGGSGLTGTDRTPSPVGSAEKAPLRDIRHRAGGATDGWGPGR